MACLPIDQGSAFDCADINQAGAGTRIYLFDYESYKTNTVTPDPDGTITLITNATGVQSYLVEVPDGSNIETGNAVRENAGGVDTFDHSVKSMFYDISQASKNNISKMRFKKVVAIVQRLDGDFQLFGAGGGLKLTASDWNLSDPAKGNGIDVTMATPTTQGGEAYLPVTVFDTDAATTLAMLEATLIVGA